MIEISHPDNQVEKFEYHLDGTLAKKTASNGTVTQFDYDCFGRVLSERAFAKGKLLYQTSNVYDSLHKTSSTDASGVTTSFEYDSAGRLCKTTCLDKEEYYEYDLLGRLEKKIEPFGHQTKVTRTTYDFLDRLVEERIEDDRGHILKQISFKYDALGNRTHVIEETAAGTSENVVLYNLDQKPIKTVDPKGHEFHVTYDKVKKGRDQWVLQMTTTDSMGRQTLVTCDVLERPAHIKKVDLNGLLLAEQDVCYDGCGNQTRTLDHLIVQGKKTGSLETTFEYDAMGQLNVLTLAKGLRGATDHSHAI